MLQLLKRNMYSPIIKKKYINTIKIKTLSTRKSNLEYVQIGDIIVNKPVNSIENSTTSNTIFNDKFPNEFVRYL
jgi:hypothetical protein